MKKKFLIAIAILVLAMPFTAKADTLRHPELNKFEEQGGKVEFLGAELGLDGWLLLNKAGDPSYAYTTPEGGLVIGMLVGPDGKIKTRDQLVAYQDRIEGGQAAVPGAVDAVTSKAEKLYAETEKKSLGGCRE